MCMELLQDILAPVRHKASVPGGLSHCPDKDLTSLHLSYPQTAAGTAVRALQRLHQKKTSDAEQGLASSGFRPVSFQVN